MDTKGGDIVAKDRAQIVLGDHSDIARGSAEIGQAGDGVGGRAAGAFDGRPHGRVKRRRASFVD